MKRTKKLVALVLVAVLAITSVVGTTLAYFKDSDKATNTFTFGNVKIEQYEKDRYGEKYEQGQVVYPATPALEDKTDITAGGLTFKIRNDEGNYVDKIVTVKNTGSMPAYVRTIIAVPSMGELNNNKDATFNPLHWNYRDATDKAGRGWDWDNDKENATDDLYQFVSDVQIGDVVYDIYVATFNDEVAPEEETMPSLVGFYLHPTVGYDDNGYFYIGKDDKTRIDLDEWFKVGNDGKVTMNILVLSQAAQTEGFADAWEALDTAFGEVNDANVAEWFA